MNVFFKCHIFVALIIVSIVASCKKKDLLFKGNVTLSFSQNEVVFDTLFTSVGSTTKRFKVFNPLSKPISISKIWLENDARSMFRFNIDGKTGTSVNNIEIEAKDSAYVFVEVTIDPSSGRLPFIIEDKLMFLTGSKTQSIELKAWGQDAIFHVNESLSGTHSWNNTKPHVIYGTCLVDSNATLNIQEGTKVYFHRRAQMLVYKSTINANGRAFNPITFQHDRREDYLLSNHEDTPGQWYGVRFLFSKSSSLNYVNIFNATYSIIADSISPGHTITLNAVWANNASGANLVSRGGFLKAENCLFSSAGEYSGFFSIGGSIEMDHCTFANYWQGNRKNGLFAVKNYYKDANEVVHYRPFTKFKMTNSIIYGNKDNELIFDTLSRRISGVSPVNIELDNCIIKNEKSLDLPNFQNIHQNIDPFFENEYLDDFSLHSSSFAKGRAVSSTVNTDLKGYSRGFPASIGCFD